MRSGLGVPPTPELALHTLVEEFFANIVFLHRENVKILNGSGELPEDSYLHWKELDDRMKALASTFQSIIQQFKQLDYDVEGMHIDTGDYDPMSYLLTGDDAALNRAAITEFFRKKWHVRYGYEASRKEFRQQRTALNYYLMERVITPVLMEAGMAHVKVGGLLAK